MNLNYIFESFASGMLAKGISCCILCDYFASKHGKIKLLKEQGVSDAVLARHGLSSGYSGKPLAEKLGLKKGQRAVFVDVPGDYFALIGRVSKQVMLAGKSDQDLDFVHIFARTEEELSRSFDLFKDRIAQNGMIWISWPKASSKLKSTLEESTVRAVGLRGGLVDVKICAIDKDWSGLKFVRRISDRN